MAHGMTTADLCELLVDAGYHAEANGGTIDCGQYKILARDRYLAISRVVRSSHRHWSHFATPESLLDFLATARVVREGARKKRLVDLLGGGNYFKDEHGEWWRCERVRDTLDPPDLQEAEGMLELGRGGHCAEIQRLRDLLSAED